MSAQKETLRRALGIRAIVSLLLAITLGVPTGCGPTARVSFTFHNRSGTSIDGLRLRDLGTQETAVPQIPAGSKRDLQVDAFLDEPWGDCYVWLVDPSTGLEYNLIQAPPEGTIEVALSRGAGRSLKVEKRERIDGVESASGEKWKLRILVSKTRSNKRIEPTAQAPYHAKDA